MVCKGMKFSRFPLDEHICYLKLTSCESTSFTPETLTLCGQSYELAMIVNYDT